MTPKFQLPDWMPKQVKMIENCLTYTTVTEIKGQQVPVQWIWGDLYRFFQDEYEHLLFFSDDIGIVMHNGEVFADTTDRIGALYTIQKINRAKIGSGQQSVIYNVTLSKGTSIKDIEGALEKMWRDESAGLKEINVDKKVWRSTIPPGDR